MAGTSYAADRQKMIGPMPHSTTSDTSHVHPRSAPNTTAAIQIDSNSFSPASVTINVGENVTWTRVNGFHNVSADDGSFRLGEPPDGAPGSSWGTASHTFTQAGTFRYYCEIHGAPNGVGMAGVVIVQAASPTTSVYLPLVVK